MSAMGRGGKWYGDEVVVTINGAKHWLWRAVDQHGAVPGCLMCSRETSEAKRFTRKLLRRYGCPRVIVTDKLRSGAAAASEPGRNVEHR